VWGQNTHVVIIPSLNALVTGLIVFKILKVFLAVKAAVTSADRTLGSTGGNKLRDIIFVIVESGMALFAIQLVRVVLTCLPRQPVQSTPVGNGLNFVVAIHQMLNVIIRCSYLFVFLY